MIRTCLLSVCGLALTGCGYRVGSHGDLLPTTLKTIAIPAFDNITDRYKLSDRLPAAITREFLSRTRYQVVSDQNQADAILRGSFVNYMSLPNVVDEASGRATGVQIIAVLNISLVERETGKVLYTRPNLEARNRYEIAIDQNAYFEESDIGLDRLSRDIARTLVSAVLESF